MDLSKKIAPEAPARKGRPALDAEALRTRMVEAAKRVLVSGTGSGLTIDAVAAEAGMAKKTVYRFVADSNDLLAQIVRSWTDRYAAGFGLPPANAVEAEDSLRGFLTQVAQEVVTEESAAMFRLLASDAALRAQFLDRYTQNGVGRARNLLADWLVQQRAAGLIALPGLPGDQSVTADLILSMTIAEPLRRIVLGDRAAADPHVLAARIEAALGLLRLTRC